MIIIIFLSLLAILLIVGYEKINTLKDKINKITKENKELNRKENEKYEITSRELQIKLEDLDRQILNKKTSFDILNTSYNEAQERLVQIVGKETEVIAREINFIRDSEIKQLNDEIACMKKEQLEVLQKEHEEKMKALFTEQSTLTNDLAPLRQEIEDYRAKRQAINENIVREQEMSMKKDFHRIIISEEDSEDIVYLSQLEKKVNNKEILRKLIYETYLKTPLDDLIKRVANGRKVCGIYKITNIETKQCYIGKSVEITPKRWREHIKASLNIGNTIAKSKIHQALKEGGWNNFTFEILEECQREQLTEREKYYIAFFESNVYGYNHKVG